jgi:hypothetical protein
VYTCNSGGTQGAFTSAVKDPRVHPTVVRKTASSNRREDESRSRARQPPGTGKTLPDGWVFVKKFRRTRLDMPPLLAAVHQRQGFHFDRGTMYNSGKARKKKDNIQDFMRSYSKGSSRCRMQVLLLSYEQLGSLPSYTRVTRRSAGSTHTYLWLFLGSVPGTLCPHSPAPHTARLNRLTHRFLG